MKTLRRASCAFSRTSAPRAAALAGGGELAFELVPEPAAWGTSAEALPPRW